MRALGLCLAVTFAATMSGPASAALPAADTVAVEKAVRLIYQAEAGTKGRTLPYTSGYLALQKRCSAAQTAFDRKFGRDEGFGMCGEDGSPVCDCQDLEEATMLRTLKLEVVETVPGVAQVTARFLLFKQDANDASAQRAVQWRMVRTTAGWQADDIVGADDAGKPTLSRRAVLETGIADMRKRLKLAQVAVAPLTQPAR